MLAYLQGTIQFKHDDYIILNVNNVGYKVFVTNNIINAHYEPTEVLELFIETSIREDAFNLFGFTTRAEQVLFNKITTVSGVGPKVGLAILSHFNGDQLIVALQSQDKNAFKPVSGVGPKLAERIITELKNYAAKQSINSGVITSGALSPANTGANLNAQPSLVAEGVSALTNLGYPASDASRIVQKAIADEGIDNIEDLIKASLSGRF